MNREDKAGKRKLGKITGGNKASARRKSGKVSEKRRSTALNLPPDLAQQYLDIASVIILVIDANRKISLINKKGCQVLGYDASDIVGKDWFTNFIPERIREEVKSVFDQLMSSQIEPTEYFENTIINSYGKERLIAWHNTIWRDESGNIIGTLSSGEDITERKQTDEALKTSEQKLRSLMDFSPVGITWADLKTEAIIYINHKFTELFGYTHEDIPTIQKWFDLAFPVTEYQKAVRSRRSSFESAHVKGNDNPPHETAIRCKNGSIKYAMVATNIIDDQILAVFNDVTDRKLAEESLKASEEKYRLLVENSSEAIVVLQDRILKYANPKCSEITGYTADELTSRLFIDFVHQDDREMVATRHVKRLKGEDVPTRYQFRLINKQGIAIWGEINGVLLSWEGRPATLSFFTDITERKKIEQALKDSEEKYRLLVENANEAIIVIQERKIIFSNRKTSDIIGYTPDELGSRPFTDFIHQDDVEMVAARHVKRLKGEYVPAVYQFRAVDKNGDIKWVEINAVLISWEGKPATLNFLSDITDRIKAEEALKESEEKYRNLVENTNEGIWVIDKDANTTYVNSAMASMFGYTTTEMTGRHLLSFMTEEQQKIAPGYLKRRSTGIKDQHEFHFNKKDGSTIYTILSTIPLYDDHGQYSGAVAAVTDITNRKQAEDRIEKIAQEWRATFDSIADYISIHDRDYNIVRMNRAFIDLLKMKPQEIVGKKCYELFHGTMLPISECPHYIAINSKHVQSCERFEPNLNMYLEITCAPIHDKTGEITGVVHVAKNITDRKHMELAAIQHKKLEALGGLAGGIAHDFNNILTALLGNISLAKLTVKAEEKTTERLIVAEKATMRAKELTQQLLTFAKGGAPIKKTASIIDIVKDTTKFALHGSNIDPDFSIPETLWNADVDIGQISQVIHNLVLNAKEAMPNGGILKLKVENIVLDRDSSLPLPEGNYIKITVEDKGIGIPEDNLRKIFDPYFTTKQTGSGLGLATSYSIIKNHQGFMSVNSELGVGTTFIIYLPATIKEIIPAVSEDHKPEISKLKILVMDDEESILDIATSMLKYLGHEDIELARNGNEAIEEYKKAKDSSKPFDVVILDLTIPGNMGGKEVVKKLLEIDPAVKAIVSSGYSSDPIMSNYQQYGFYAIVPKPYTIEDMERVLGKVIQS